MFPQIANSPIHLQHRKPYIMHLLDSLTEQEKLMSFLCDHISPWPLHHMVAKQPESCSQLASVQARSSICKSACSTSSLGCRPGTQAGTQVPEGAPPAYPRPQDIFQQLQCLSGHTAHLCTGLLALRQQPQFPTFLPACCGSDVLPAFTICSPFSYLPSMLDPSPGGAHFLPGNKKCIRRRESTQSLFLS